MQLVDDRLYILYNRVTGMLGAILATLSLVSLLYSPLAFLHTQVGITPVVGILGFIQFLYAILLFKHQRSAWIGGLYAAMILCVNTLILIQFSGQQHSWFLLLWFIEIFIVGMYGLYALVAFGFLISIELLVINPESYFDPYAIGAVGAVQLSNDGYKVWDDINRGD